MHLRISVLCLCLHWQCSCFSWTVFFKQFYALLRLSMRKKKTVQCTLSSKITHWSYAIFLTTVLPTPQSQILYPNILSFSVFTNLVFRLTWTYHLFLLPVVLKKKNELDLNFTYITLGRRKKYLLVQSHNTNWTYKRHTFISFTETRKAHGKRDGCTQSPLNSVTVCSIIRGNKIFTWKPNWNFMLF
jgi:hypothetical protein